MQTAKLAGLFVALLVALLVTMSSHAADEQVCDESAAIVTASPSRTWVVSVQEKVCSTENGAVANVQVSVASSQATMESEAVVTTAVPRTRDEWPKAVWRSNTLLEVWVPNLAHVLEVKPAYRDVAVSLKYCGDDPTARARVAQYQVDQKRWMEEVTLWAKLRKVDPAAAGPRPARPEAPSDSNRACRAGDIPE